MAVAQEVTVATIGANSGGVSHEGEIRNVGSRYVLYLDGTARAQAGSLESAAHRLTELLRTSLPRQRDSNWG
jgi:hypothetical protein